MCNIAIIYLPTQYGLRQHVTGPTHISGNTLDLILSSNEQISEELVSKAAVYSVWFSDHHLLTCRWCHCRSQSRRCIPIGRAQDRHGSLQSRSATTMLCQPSTTTTFAKRAYRCSAPAVWNSLLKTVVNSNSVTVFKSRLKILLFSRAFSLPFSQ